MAAIQFPNILLGPGTFNSQVIDNNGAPSTVLEADQPFSINAQWTVSPLAALLLGGDWEVAAYVESVGPGPEQQIGPTSVVPLTGATNYNTVINVPANTLPDDPGPGQSGVYKLAMVLTHRNFGLVTDVAAVVEGPVLRIG